jgi:hypothetical protein
VIECVRLDRIYKIKLVQFKSITPKLHKLGYFQIANGVVNVIENITTSIYCLFCFVYHIEISQTTMLHVVFFISLESFWLVLLHQLCLRLFGATMWKLLIIEPFFQWKLIKIETENCIRMWGHSWCCWKDFNERDSTKFISQFSKAKVWRYWFWVGFVAENSNKLQKLGLGGKIIWARKMFTLGPTT